MINYESFCEQLDTELTKFCFTKETYVYSVIYTLGDFVLFRIEQRFDKKDIWYRNHILGYLNRVMFNENLETTEQEWNKVTAAITNVLEDYKKYRVQSKLDEIDEDFL